MDWVNYRIEVLLGEWVGALIPTALIWFLLRRFVFRAGRLCPVYAAGVAWVITGTLRSLGGADGGPVSWLDGFSFMLVPAVLVLFIDYGTTGGRKLGVSARKGGERRD